MKKRNCQYCGKTDYMVRTVDKEHGIYDVRHRVCYQCHPELDSDSHLNGPTGGLKVMKSDHRDLNWDYCEPLPISKSVEVEEEVEEYANEDTTLDVDVENLSVG